MQFDLDSGLHILRRTPQALDALLRDLPDNWARVTEGPDTWSAYDVVGHLIHGDETDWIPRARVILDHGPSKPFEPFDRFAQFEAVEASRSTSSSVSSRPCAPGASRNSAR